MDIRLNNARTAVVDHDYNYFDAQIVPPPREGKMLCINKDHRVATISVWSDSFTHWAPLPSFSKATHD